MGVGVDGGCKDIVKFLMWAGGQVGRWTGGQVGRWNFAILPFYHFTFHSSTIFPPSPRKPPPLDRTLSTISEMGTFRRSSRASRQMPTAPGCMIVSRSIGLMGCRQCKQCRVFRGLFRFGPEEGGVVGFVVGEFYSGGFAGLFRFPGQLVEAVEGK